MRQHLGRAVAFGGLCTLLVAAFAPVALASQAYTEWSGRQGTSSFDGTAVQINGSSFHPGDDSCVLYDNVVEDSDRQLEVGLARCGDHSPGLDTQACQEHVYAEQLFEDGSTACNTPGTFTNNTYYTTELSRASSTSHLFEVYLFASRTHFPADDLGSFGSTVNIRTWGEEFSNVNSACHGWGDPHANGYFRNWQHFEFGSGWTNVTNSVAPNHFGACWDVGSMNGGGDYGLTHVPF
jgi:hypothetical protein